LNSNINHQSRALTISLIIIIAVFKTSALQRIIMPRDDQYTKNDTGLYVSELAEDGLEEGNPFLQQDDDDDVLADTSTGQLDQNDPKAIAALLGRNADALPDETADGVESAVDAESDNNGAPSDQHSPPKRRRSSPLEAVTSDEAVLEIEGQDPEVRRLIKRARHDSQALLVKPGDDVSEEEAKMRANLELHGTSIVEEEREEKEGERPLALNGTEENQDVERSVEETEVEPGTFGRKRLQDDDNEEERGIERDDGDEDDDIEDKGGDDYDVENYANFEDDQDDVGQEMEELGPEVDERLVVDEDELAPGAADEAALS
ncbi:hypothetical protein B0H66DRAFT_272663, partial [Apodospora peruviana]